MDLADLVDLADPSTWPQAVKAFVNETAEQYAGATEFTADLPSALIQRESEFHSLLGGRRVIAFHCTRLLDHEVGAIRTEGLRRLTRQLVESRIAQACQFGDLTDNERDYCRESNVYAINNLEGRENKICLVVGRGIFDDPESVPGLLPFLGGWGGEAMHGGPGPDDDPVLSRLGEPAIVSVALNLAGGDRQPFFAPGLAKVFIGTQLGLEDAYGEVHLFDDIRAGDVLDIWQPGDDDYDRHTRLPGIG